MFAPSLVGPAACINDCLRKWQVDKTDVDLVASHGQSIYHAPATLHSQEKFGNATLQIGDGDHLAVATGIITISDMRQKNIAAGGEGAPLAVYADHLLFSKKGEDRVLLNIGGIANFTYLPGDSNMKILCTDVGPGNTMMDTYMQEQFPGKFYDEDGKEAASGIINEALLAALKADAFFDKPLPRSTGPELFNLAYLDAAKQRSKTENITVEDTLATLNRFTAETIASAMVSCIKHDQQVQVFTSGGGMHNPVLMQHLKTLLPGFTFNSSETQGVDPDAKEAILFALLANECVSGDVSTFAGMGAGIPAVSMGKISFPY
jgi:anhydro-N-acetylmuramic acid kinase